MDDRAPREARKTCSVQTHVIDLASLLRPNLQGVMFVYPVGSSAMHWFRQTLFPVLLSLLPYLSPAGDCFHLSFSAAMMHAVDMIRTLGQVSTVTLLGNDVGDNAGGTTAATLLDGGSVLGALDRKGSLLGVLGGKNDTLARLGGLNADGLGVDDTRVLFQAKRWRCADVGIVVSSDVRCPSRGNAFDLEPSTGAWP